MANQGFEHDWFSKPGDTVLALMRRRDVLPTMLAGHLDGNMETMRGLISGVVRIDWNIAATIAHMLGGTQAFWLRRQANYDAALERATALIDSDERHEWLRQVPAPGAKPSGRLSEARARAELRRRLAFFNVNDLAGWYRRYGAGAADVRYRTSAAFTSAEGPLALWLRWGELEAELIPVQRWSAEALRARLVAIRAMSRIGRPSRFLPRLRSALADCGVALAIVRAPKGCRASGACQMLSPDKAAIIMSFRHRSDDQFWFTLFHEIGHLLLHGGQRFVDDDGSPFDKFEREANEFASDCLIPEFRRSEFNNLRNDRDDIVRFSVSIGIAPGITVGQMQHEGMLPFNRRNRLKRIYTGKEIDAGTA